MADANKSEIGLPRRLSSAVPPGQANVLLAPEVAAPAPTAESAILSKLQSRYVDTALEVSFRDLIGVLPADESTHGLYPYPARLLRHIPRFLLNSEQIVGGIELVVDPFCGSGTVLLEAQSKGLDAYGIEQNPIGALVSSVKTTAVEIQALKTASQDLLAGAKYGRRFASMPTYLRRWYSPEAFSALSRMAWALDGYDGAIGNALSLCLALTARKVANTDRRIPVPVRPRVAKAYTARDVWAVWERETNRVAERVGNLPRPKSRTKVWLGDARDSASWDIDTDAAGTLIFTSPPYGAAQKYIRSTSLELGWLGHSSVRGTIHLERNSIGREHLSGDDIRMTSSHALTEKVRNVIAVAQAASATRGAIYSNYFADMTRVIDQMKSHASRVVLISGTNTVGGLEIQTYDLLAEILKEKGFSRTLSLRDEIRGRSLLTKRRANGSPSNAEFIEIFERGF